MNNIVSKNTILIFIGIFSIVSLLLLYRNHTKEQITVKKQPETFKRTNPVPIFNPTMDLDAKYYESIPEVQKKNIKIILCYADWCSNCHKLLPKFQQLKDTNPLPNVKYIMVEEKDKSPDIKYHNMIEYYPSILIDVEGKVELYSGPTTKTAIIKYVNSL